MPAAAASASTLVHPSRRPTARTPKRRPAGPVAATTPLAVDTRRFSASFQDAFKQRPEQARSLLSERLKARSVDENVADTEDLVQALARPELNLQRRTLVAAYVENKSELMLVHKLAELPRDALAGFMRDYFDAGGALAPVLQWLRIAGSVMRGTAVRPAAAARTRSHAASRDLFGKIFNPIGDLFKKGAEAVGNLVDSLADAVVSVGKSLGDMVSDAVSWTVGEVSDLVDSLVRAGEKVGDILAAAAAKSLDQLKKYVEAMRNVGRSVGELMAWAVTRVESIANTVVSKLLALGSKIADVVKAVLAAGRNAVIAAVRGVLAAGKKVADVLAAFATEALAVVQPVIDALLAVGRSLRDVLVEAAKLTASAVKTVVSALLELGRTLQQLLVEAANAAVSTLKVIAGALLGLGRSLAQLVRAVVAEAAALVKVVVSALLELGQKLADVVAAAVSLGAAAVKVVLAALLALGRKVIDILFTVMEATLNAKRLVMEALLAMGIAMGALLVDICENIAQAFRRGFFEGLLELGKTPLLLLKAAFEFKASCALLAFAVLLEMFGGYRELEKDERAEARRIFGGSIDLDRVKLGFAKLPYDLIDYVNLEIPRAFTTMYLLNFGPGAKVKMTTVIHELTHVWQGIQKGPLYMTQALEAQIGAGVASLLHTGKYDDSAAYTVTEQELLNAAGDFSKFNPEEQAQIVEDYWGATRELPVDADADGVVTGSEQLAADARVALAKLLRPYARQVFTPIRSRSAGLAVARRGGGAKARRVA